MRIVVSGHNLPGKSWASADETYDNVQVGVQERRDPAGLVAGDAASATWQVDVRVSVDDAGELDFKGPAVHGKRGERFLYLTWGNVGPDGSFNMFRRAKLMLNHVDPDLVRAADQSERPVLARVDLTDRCGGPRCARVGPPALSWTLDSRR